MSATVLVVGSGGREHALCWLLDRSPSVGRLLCAPGSHGIAAQAECHSVPADDIEGIIRLAAKQSVDLVVVGPEAPLAAGLSDRLMGEGVLCFGPTAAAARLESSKGFAKSFMQRHAIPTARFEAFSDPEAASALASTSPWGYPVVVKADGLAGGKGVLICASAEEALAAVRKTMVGGAYGAAGASVVIEEFLTGIEVTVMALADGACTLPLLPSQDHKQAFDGDRGPNTGGMGAFAPADAVIESHTLAYVHTQILQRTVDSMAAEGTPFRGVLYAGVMLTDDGPRVLEYNCRFGDPETQVVLPLLREDAAELFAAVAAGSAASGLPAELSWSSRSAACIILAAGGYPGAARNGDAITGLTEAGGASGANGKESSDETVGDVIVFHAGTHRGPHGWATAGGRVLGVTALGDNLAAALDAAYNAVGTIRFEHMHYRGDIGRRPGTDFS